MSLGGQRDGRGGKKTIVNSPGGCEDHVPVDDHLPRDNGFPEGGHLLHLLHELRVSQKTLSNRGSRSCRDRAAVAGKDEYPRGSAMTVPDVQLTGGVADQVQGVSSLPDAAYSSRDVDTALVPHGFESRMPHMLGVIPSEEAFTGDLVGVVGRPDDGCHIGVEGHELRIVHADRLSQEEELSHTCLAA